jgi:hypothetical protein
VPSQAEQMTSVEGSRGFFIAINNQNKTQIEFICAKIAASRHSAMKLAF